MKLYLNEIDSPSNLKQLPVTALPALAEEIRQTLIRRITATGGHMGSNLGFIEPTLALHYVFDSPHDKFVFDVSHQCYTHKILTGRKAGFLNPERYHDFSGYTNPGESAHDPFIVGHTSTSVSLAVGLAQARDLTGGTEKIVAIIGDGSMSGGEAFEGLDNAAMLDSQFMVVLNDNEMSIAPNQGGLYRNFAALRASHGQAECNFFKALGFDYLYVEDGNDTAQLVAAFERAKDLPHPVVVHLHTAKGKGLDWAEQNQEAGHWALPAAFDADAYNKEEHYESLTAAYLLEKIRRDPTVIAISPATPSATGMTAAFRARAGRQFCDVGIAEEHAVAFASGLAKNGAKPVLLALGMFLQRTYDQLAQDLALNRSAATILAFWGGLSGGDATHTGAFDMSMMSNIPHLICLAPVTKEEYFAMLDWSIEQQEYPVVIRVPGQVNATGVTETFDATMRQRYRIAEGGEKVAILGLGSFFGLGRQVKTLLQAQTGIDGTLINPRCYSEVDEKTLTELKSHHQLVVTLEDGILAGGFGEKVDRFYGPSTMKVLNFGGFKEFTDRIPLDELYRRYHLTPEQIVADIVATIK
ncbi:MAG: 1-deoxy-D-xylulose-5-phosphate synthase [Victivallales bacterium]|nr:1-deoxy-D-xylulose-5-phosphate synthase [Victivallales bacterium]